MRWRRRGKAEELALICWPRRFNCLVILRFSKWTGKLHRRAMKSFTLITKTKIHLAVAMARHHHRVNIRSSTSSSSNITISKLANPSARSQWTTSQRRWSSSRAVESRETMLETEAVTITNRPHHHRKWESEVRKIMLWCARVITIRRLSHSTRIKCDTRSIICWKSIQVIIIIIRLEKKRNWEKFCEEFGNRRMMKKNL